MNIKSQEAFSVISDEEVALWKKVREKNKRKCKEYHNKKSKNQELEKQ